MEAKFEDKLTWLCRTLENAGDGLTFEQIMNTFRRSSFNKNGAGISRRTFFNWKNELYNRFGIEIKCRKLNTSCYVYSIDGSKNDATDWIKETLSLQNTIAENITIKERIILEPIPNCRFLDKVMFALRNNRIIKIVYKDYWEDEEKLQIKPLFVKMFRQRWHVIGPEFTENRQTNKRQRLLRLPAGEAKTIRSYALDDRMKSLEVTNIGFVYPEEFSPTDYYFNNFSTLKLPEGHLKTETIRILVWENKNFYYRSVPIHSSQNEVYTSNVDGYSIFEYRLQPTIDFIQELRSHGNEIEVLSPKWLRRQFVQDIKDMADAYKGKDRKTLKEPLPPEYEPK